MKRAIKAMTVLILITALLTVSCTQNPPASEPGCGSVRLSTATEKGLDILDAGGIDHYEYEAHPRFTLEGGQYLKGETNWKTLEADENSSEIIGPFTQGYWKFGLRALAPLGETIWEGEGEGYVSETSLSVIPITMHRVEGSGTLVLELDIPESSASMPNPTVKVDNVTASITWTKTGTGTGTVSYKGSVADVSAGWHEVVIRFVSGSVEAGSATAVQMIPGNTVIIRGALEVGEYERPHLKIDAPTAARGEIRRNGETTGLVTDTMEKNETRTYRYAFTSGRSNATVTWYVNGEEAGAGATFTFAPKANGTYEIAGLSHYYAESTFGGTWIEESSSASITVLVHPEMSLITWKNGKIIDKSTGVETNEERITRQRLPFNTEFTVGAPAREGYDFSHWSVTGGDKSVVYAGETFKVTEATYTFTSVWTQRPCIELSLSSGLVLTYSATSSSTIPVNGAIGRISSASSSYPATSLAVRWFLDGKEIFWICDKGNGTYSIPGAAEAKIEPGAYPLEARVQCGAKTTSCTTTVTWR